MSKSRARGRVDFSIAGELDVAAPPPPDTGKDDPARVVARIFREHNEALVRFLYVKLRSIQDAREVAQEAYVRMLKLDEPGAISHLQAYLFKTASNIAIDRLRRDKRRPEFLRDGGGASRIASGEPGADEVVEGRQKIELLRRGIGELAPKCRKAFLLYKFEDRSYGDIAGIMGLSESMIRKYVLRALVHCRSRIDSAE